MNYYLIIFYFVGLLQEFLLTLYLRFVAKGKAFPAATLSLITTLIGLLVIYNILILLEAQRSIPAIIVYALGVATGTFVAMKFRSGFKD